jgi:Ca2+-binding RTX toxin-like protein
MTDAVRWGEEFLVNSTTARSQSGSSITALGDGRFIVIWHDYSNTGDDQSYSAVRAQIFNADGSPSGDEFVVNTTTENSQMPGAVTTLPDGRFVVVWEHNTGDYSVFYEVVAQIFNPDGTKAGPEMLVNTTWYDAQRDPKVATLTDGGFVVTWTSTDVGSEGGLNVRGQIFNGDGTPRGSEFLVDTTSGAQENAEVIGLADGRFVVIWQDTSASGGDTSGYAVRGQVFNADGTTSGGEFLVNTGVEGYQFYPAVTALADGGFAVTWWDYGANSVDGTDVRVQVYNTDGTPRGAEILVNTTSASMPSITTLADGRFVVVWHDGGIRAQVFNPDGTKSGGEIAVSTTEAGLQWESAVTALPDGRFAVSWTDGSGSPDDPDDYAIRAQIIDPRGSAVTFDGTAAGEQYAGTIFDDALNGAAGADVLFGAAGNDVIDGGEGDDAIDGGNGADNLRGGAGRDTASYANASTGVTVSLAAGAGTGGEAAGDVLIEIENLTGSSFDDSLTGDGGDNVLSGAAGADVLAGLAGDDELSGGEGADALDGGAGNDIASYAASTAGVTVNLATGTGTNGDAAGDTLAGIENLSGSAFNDTLSGDGNANAVAGNGGNDQLDGAAGDDTLDGGEGDDLLTGGSGADRLRGGAGKDTASYAMSSAAVAVSLAAGLASGGDGQGDTLNGIENVIGSAFADTLTGDANANVLTGGAGGDRLDGGTGSDTASYASAGAAVTVNLTTGTGSVGDAQGDVLVGIENLTGSAFNDTLIGDNNANVLAGGDGADQLNGGAGADTTSYVDSTAGVTVSLATGTGAGGSAQGDVLVQIENLTGSAFNDTLIGDGSANVLNGGDGDDVINGGAGDDLLIGGAGNDDITGGDGIDTVSYAAATAGINIDLHFTGSRQDGGDGLDQFHGDIENLIGSAFDDVIVGNDAANVLVGGDGDDEIWAIGAGDRLIGGAGNDYLSAGGYGTDTFVFGANSGDDLVVGFTAKAALPSYIPHDVIEIDPNVLPNFAAVMAAATEDEYGNTIIRLSDTSSIALWSVPKASLSAEDFLFVSPDTSGNDTLVSTAGNDTLNGGSGIDTASYSSASAGVTVSLAISGPQNTIGAGTDTLVSIENLTGSGFADTLFGNNQNNVLVGGAGNDRLTGQDGRDTLTGGAGSDVFDFNAVSETTANPVMCDVITDFAPGSDRIDLSTIDANWFKGGNQSFRLIGTEDFSMRAGEVRYEIVDQSGTANDRTIVYGDTDGNGSSDFQIELIGLHTLSSRDFVL